MIDQGVIFIWLSLAPKCPAIPKDIDGLAPGTWPLLLKVRATSNRLCVSRRAPGLPLRNNLRQGQAVPQVPFVPSLAPTKRNAPFSADTTRRDLRTCRI